MTSNKRVDWTPRRRCMTRKWYFLCKNCKISGWLSDYIWRLKVLFESSGDRFNNTKQEMAEKGARHLSMAEEQKYYVSKIKECHQQSSEVI
ncbi:hypothetical protein TNCV_411881 [Trichonephila clavipes]|nr:hypothetical protein TNCV_411881 [Trichonephila clavipes]